MNPLLLLAIGLGIVVGGILWLRLHAFLALILGAFVVGGLTSAEHMRASMQAKYRGDMMRAAVKDGVAETVRKQKEAGQAFDVKAIGKDVRTQVSARQEEFDAQAKAKADSYVVSNTTLKRITSAAGIAFGKIGLLIAMACVIGRCLLASGAAERIVRSALSIVGEKAAPVAFAGSAFLLGIPVFFDSLFLLGIPLVKAAWLKLRKNYLLLVMALVAGGTMTHSLVPPTPGPLFVAEELGINLGLMIIVGMAIGICSSASGLLFAAWLNRRYNIPLRETPEALEKLEQLSKRDISELPSLTISLVPILLPVVLIAGATIYKGGLDPSQAAPALVNLLGDKNIALTISAAVAMLIAASRLKDRKAVADHVQDSMVEAGVIILICCGGGAFGAMLQQSGIGPYINSLTGDEPLDFGLLPVAFIVTAIIRGAQGSATVAMFTGVAIVGSITPDVSVLSYHPVYLAVAIGCGSKPFPWMNDSGFWVVSKMSGITEAEMLKTQFPLLTVMGFSGITVTLIAAKVFPMVGN